MKIERQRTGENSGLWAYRAVKNGPAEEAIERERTAAVLAAHRNVIITPQQEGGAAA